MGLVLVSEGEGRVGGCCCMVGAKMLGGAQVGKVFDSIRGRGGVRAACLVRELCVAQVGCFFAGTRGRGRTGPAC
jgi:hypothetical protein